MDGRIVLNSTEQRRIIVLNHLASGALVNAEAAQLLGLSKRKLQRLHKAYSEEGLVGLVHGNRGRPAHNAVEAATATRVVELARDKYQGFNQQHLTEMLAEHEGISLSRPTVRRILLAAGISSPRRRRAAKHRRRRDRYPREGMLLQLDASRHDWLEARGPYLTGC
jgi:transposase